MLQIVMVCLLWLACTSSIQAAVSISGVDEPVRNNILAYLQLDDEACDAHSWRVRNLFAESESEIREALEVVGYYHVEIEKKLELGEACWQASFSITPGKPVVLRTVSIEVSNGDERDEKLATVVQECALRNGDILQHANYDLCRRNITRVAKSQGYFDARFIERRIDVYSAEHAADITLLFETGRRYVFGKTTFDQTILDPDLVQHFVAISPASIWG